MKKGKKRKILWITLAVIIIILIIIRIFLAEIMLNQLNKKLADIDGYEGHIEDLDLHLYRGALKVYDVKIDKFNKDKAEPFVHLRELDTSIEWKSLWKGAIVAKIFVENPQINLKVEQNGELEQDGTEVDWVSFVKTLSPITINKIEVMDGKVNVDFPDTDEALFDYDLKNIDILITNITNVEDRKKALPSDISFSATSTGYKGDINLEAQANLLKEIPDMDLNLTVDALQLPALNSFMKQYTGTDFESGTMNLYTEVALKDNYFTGYIKPSLQDPVFFKWKEEGRSFIQGAKELIAEGVQELFENQKKEQTATKIEFSGDMENVDVKYWQTFYLTVKNAWIEALKNQLDNTVAFAQVSTEKK